MRAWQLNKRSQISLRRFCKLAITGAICWWAYGLISAEPQLPEPKTPQQSDASLGSRIDMGMTYDQARKAIGEPATWQTFESQGAALSQNWYYGDSLQVCFEHGVVTSINQY